MENVTALKKTADSSHGKLIRCLQHFPNGIIDMEQLHTSVQADPGISTKLVMLVSVPQTFLGPQRLEVSLRNAQFRREGNGGCLSSDGFERLRVISDSKTWWTW